MKRPNADGSKSENTNTKDREKSPSIALKHFNNWVKAVLIQMFCKPHFQVLDLCGGKGGDLIKWMKAGISHLTLVDGAGVSVEHALNRYNSYKHGMLVDAYPAMFACADCIKVDLDAHLPAQFQFDLVSCQFALHYSFGSEETAHIFMKNVAKRLKPGGWFIGTIPNAGRIVKRLNASSDNAFGNDVYQVEFPKDVDKKRIPAFGSVYNFTLVDAVHDVPEFLVHPDVLAKIAKHHGLRPVLKCVEFDHFFEKHKETHKQLLKAIGVSEKIPDNEWQCITLYSCFVFQKEGDLQLTPPPQLEEVNKVLYYP